MAKAQNNSQSLKVTDLQGKWISKKIKSGLINVDDLISNLM